MKIKYFIPLIMFLIPTVIVSAIIWPPEAAQTGPIVGFVVMIVSMIMTYSYGIQSVLKDAH